MSWIGKMTHTKNKLFCWRIFYLGNFLGPGRCSAGITAALKGTVRGMRGTGTFSLT